MVVRVLAPLLLENKGSLLSSDQASISLCMPFFILPHRFQRQDGTWVAGNRDDIELIWQFTGSDIR